MLDLEYQNEDIWGLCAVETWSRDPEHGTLCSNFESCLLHCSVAVYLDHYSSPSLSSLSIELIPLHVVGGGGGEVPTHPVQPPDYGFIDYTKRRVSMGV